MTKSADLQRLASLSDCVFAVAMTLLAFSVRIPEQGLDRGKLPGELVRMLRESSGLVLSFVITAMFWLGQVRLFHSLRQATVGLFYLALLQLFWIVLLPISTSLWTRIEARETVLVMGMNLALIALAGLLMWIYCYRKSLFESVAVGRSIAVELVGPIFPLLVFAISLVVTLWTPILGDKLWWGAFATPFLVHLTRRPRSLAEAQATKATVVQDKHVND
jgi:uncharacterized membrane protein